MCPPKAYFTKSNRHFSKRIHGVDGIRALACLMVMTHHAFKLLVSQNYIIQEMQLFFLTGSAGVAIFFVLSGFLLSVPFWQAWRESLPLPSLKIFILRRWARIAPAFWIILQLSFLLSLYIVPEKTDLAWRFLAGLTFTSCLTWKTLFPVELNAPLWSISFEVFSYSFFTMFVFFWFRLPGKRTLSNGFKYWFAVLILILLAHYSFLVFGKTDGFQEGWRYGLIGGAKEWWPVYNPAVFFAMFLIGVLASGITDCLKRSHFLSTIRFSLICDLIVFAALCGTLFILWSVRGEVPYVLSLPKSPYYFPLFSILIGIILAFSPYSAALGSALDNPFFRFISTISFGLYIWHYLLLRLACIYWRTHIFHDLRNWSICISLVYIESIILATLSWVMLEKPFIRWSHRSQKK